jgi:hypothetical protein
MAEYHLAQINIARLRAPIDDPLTAEFVAGLEPTNALAEGSPGFVWRLQTEDGDATSIQAYDDELVIVNMSVWKTADHLFNYVYRSGHVDYLRNRRGWFERFGEAHMCLWWVATGELPTVEDGVARLKVLQTNGPSPVAFNFRTHFDPEAIS